jgi:hypothetical protein
MNHIELIIQVKTKANTDKITTHIQRKIHNTTVTTIKEHLDEIKISKSHIYK